MGRQVKSSYDAFISYRHADVDSFVAEELQRQLENFKLPRNIAKKLPAGSKTGIERVFRDSTELPLATNLSDPIMEALECSEYLIVICTPRLKESMWCKKELETFISMHGRGKILAVLAEGEPYESFPQQICEEEKYSFRSDGTPYSYIEKIEPLAADVRGKSKREIKKKIKDEILRMAAPMFDTAYDDLKQRHRERKLRRGMAFTTAVAAAVGVFGVSTAIQSHKIKVQSETIKSQYDNIQSQYVTIEKQYAENLAYQSQICLDSAEEKLDEDRYEEALNLCKSALPRDLKNPEFEVNDSVKYILAEGLRVYDDGETMKPYATIQTDARVYYADNIKENTVYYYDEHDTLTIYEAKKKQVLATFSTEGINSKNDIRVTNDGSVVYKSYDKIYGLSKDDYSVKWTINCMDNSVIRMSDDTKSLIVSNSETVQKVDVESGKVLVSASTSAFSEKYDCTEAIYGDSTGVYIAYDTGIGAPNDEESIFYNKKFIVVKLDADDLSKLAEYEFTANTVTFVRNDELTGKLMFAYNSLKEDNALNDINVYVVCLDDAGLGELWTKKVSESVNNLFINDKDELVGVCDYSIKFLDLEDGDLIGDANFDAMILNYYIISDGRLMVLLNDGQVDFQVVDAHNFFYDQDEFSQSSQKLSDFVVTDNIYVRFTKSKNYFMEYTFTKSDKLKKVDDPESVECPIYELIDDNLRKEYEKSLKRDFVWEVDNYVDLGSKYYALAGTTYAYIISKSDNKLVAKIHGFYSYDEKTNKIYIGNTLELYEVPFYSLEELAMMLY